MEVGGGILLRLGQVSQRARRIHISKSWRSFFVDRVHKPHLNRYPTTNHLSSLFLWTNTLAPAKCLPDSRPCNTLSDLLHSHAGSCFRRSFASITYQHPPAICSSASSDPPLCFLHCPTNVDTTMTMMLCPCITTRYDGFFMYSTSLSGSYIPLKRDCVTLLDTSITHLVQPLSNHSQFPVPRTTR